MKRSTLLMVVVIATVAGRFSDLRGQTSPTGSPSQSAETKVTRSSAFKLPDPSGTLGIGQIGYEWTDMARSDVYSTDPQAHRTLMVYLWYPSSRSTGGDRAPYWPGAKQMDAAPDLRAQMKEEFGALWPLIASGEFKSHAIENAPIAKVPKHFPVVLLSHGLGGTGFGYTALIEHLVSHGYVVVAIEHPYTASAVTFPDGRVIVPHRDPAPAGLSAEQRFQRMVDGATLEINRGSSDVVFVLKKLTELDAAETPDFLLRGRLDISHVAAVGHSAGGAFATLACQLDARIRACVSLDGEMPPVTAFPEAPGGKGFQQPVLLLEIDHTGERMPFSAADYEGFLKKKEAQLSLCPKGSYDVLLKSAGLIHGSFSDYPLRAASGDARKTEEAMHNLLLTESFTLAFLDKYLKGEKAPLLDNPTQSPEAKVKEYGH
jgi:dienelactone hydrolase